jgi:hypothetical protein
VLAMHHAVAATVRVCNGWPIGATICGVVKHAGLDRLPIHVGKSVDVQTESPRSTAKMPLFGN